MIIRFSINSASSVFKGGLGCWREELMPVLTDFVPDFWEGD